MRTTTSHVTPVQATPWLAWHTPRFIGIDYRSLHEGVLPVLFSDVGAMRVWGRLFSLSVPPAYRLGVLQESGDNVTALRGATLHK